MTKKMKQKIHPDQLLIFLHVTKTGGTSLRWALEDQFSVKEVLRCYAAKGCSKEFLKEIAISKGEQFRFLTTHFDFGTHVHFKQPTTYLTMLRDPISRTLSEFYSFYYKKNPAEIGRSDEQNTIEYYLNERSLNWKDNQQVRFISGCREGKSITGVHLRQAKDNLQRHFSAVGITEDFERSLALYCKVFGWNHMLYVRRNKTHLKERRKKPTSVQMKLLEASNTLDQELYLFAKELFENQVQELGVTDEEVNRLVLKGRRYHYPALLSRAYKKIRRKQLSLP
jgi:hypothetical protein